MQPPSKMQASAVMSRHVMVACAQGIPPPGDVATQAVSCHYSRRRLVCPLTGEGIVVEGNCLKVDDGPIVHALPIGGVQVLQLIRR